MWVKSQNTLEFSWMEGRALLLGGCLADLPWVRFDELGAFSFCLHYWLSFHCDSTWWDLSFNIAKLCRQNRCRRWCCFLDHIILWWNITITAWLRCNCDKFAIFVLLRCWMWVNRFLSRHYYSCFQYIIIAALIIREVHRGNKLSHFLFTIHHLCV